MVDGFERFKGELYSKFDGLSDAEIAKAIAYAESNEAQFLVLTYLSDRPGRREEVNRILDENTRQHGSLLDGSLSDEFLLK